MPEDLCSNVPSGVDLNTHCSHLKWAPVLVLDEILDKAGCSIVVALVARRGHPRHVGDKVFSLRGAMDEFY